MCTSFASTSTLVVAMQSHADPIASFKRANEGRGQVCVREMSIGGQPAIIGIDTGCAKCTISQGFLDRFVIPPDYLTPNCAEIDNGSANTIKTTASVLLPVNFKQGSIATEWIILPRLAAPLDALLSWSWAIKMKLIIDCEANSIDFKGPPPSTVCVSPDFHSLVPKPLAAPSIAPTQELSPLY